MIKFTPILVLLFVAPSLSAMEFLGEPYAPGKTLSEARCLDNKQYKEKKDQELKLKVEQALKNALPKKADKTSALGKLEVPVFDKLPEVLKNKIMKEYYQKTSLLVLRHKRELAPIILIGGQFDDAESVLSLIDNRVAKVKRFTNEALAHSPGLKDMKPAHNLFSSGIFNLHGHDCKIEFSGYTDRTYCIELNPERLRKLMDIYTVDQLDFFVSLAKLRKPFSGAASRIQLSGENCGIFKSLDYMMQGRLTNIYPWIDFYTPNDRVLNIDDRIENLQNSLIVRVAAHLEEAKNKLSDYYKRLL